LEPAHIIAFPAFTKSRKYVIFAIFVVAAIPTPPDVVSQVLLAIPLIVLYETGILVCRITRKRSIKQKALLEE
jgi:sec-independent protein translocase protein TatC